MQIINKPKQKFKNNINIVYPENIILIDSYNRAKNATIQKPQMNADKRRLISLISATFSANNKNPDKMENRR